MVSNSRGEVSIRAPRERGDPMKKERTEIIYVSIRAPRERGDSGTLFCPWNKGKIDPFREPNHFSVTGIVMSELGLSKSLV
jgi:hypothetical protein